MSFHNHAVLRSALGLCVLTWLAGCQPQGGQGGAVAGAGMPPPEVEVVTVSKHDVPRTEEVPGRMQAVRTAEVRARVEGVLEARLYTEGSEVKAGDVLFRIDQRALAANAEATRASLARSKAQAVLAGQTLDRMQALSGTQAVSKQDLDQAKATKSQSDAEVAASQAALTKAEIDLSYATVRAPIAGRIGRALVTEGALVGKGEATHLATIEQYHPIWVNFSQASASFIHLREAMRQGTLKASHANVRLILENGLAYRYPGKLLFNDLAVDPVTGTVGMRAEFPNPERELLPGQFVTVRLPVAQADNVITVPQRAVQAGPDGQVVMLVTGDGKVQPQPVKTAGLSGAEWIIAAGLKGGEQVIVNGVQKTRPGMPVKAVPLATGR